MIQSKYDETLCCRMYRIECQFCGEFTDWHPSIDEVMHATLNAARDRWVAVTEPIARREKFYCPSCVNNGTG